MAERCPIGLHETRWIGSRETTTMAKEAAFPASSALPAPYSRVAERLMGSRITMGLRVVVDRGIPDRLGDSAKSAGELSSQTNIPTQSIRRLMRALSYVGVFREATDERFSNTEVSPLASKDDLLAVPGHQEARAAQLWCHGKAPSVVPRAAVANEIVPYR